ncbi:MAG: hypothetical protein COA82_10150 [Alkaliphilus sp.]|nr:MAG: hypothetical protein COA82_10150 [Alkaliphilus sp.]
MIKKTKGRILLISLILLSLIISACNLNKSTDGEIISQGDDSNESKEVLTQDLEENILKPLPQHALGLIAANRIVAETNRDDIMNRIDELFYPFDGREVEIPLSQIRFAFELENEKNTWKSSVSLSDAKYDINHFFKLLRHTYAGYQYFGGDKVFLSARDNILEELENRNRDQISRVIFSKMLRDNLDFIQDTHFFIDGKVLADIFNFVRSEKYEFLIDDEGFYTILDDEKFHVVSIDNKSPDEFMKLSINKEGEVVYFLGSLIKEASIKRILLELKNDEERIEKSIALVQTLQFISGEERTYKLSEVDNIPLIEVRSMMPMSESDTSLVQFIEDAKKLKGEEVIIIDLRSNGGGFRYYLQKWIYNFSGYETTDFSSFNFRVMSNINSKMFEGFWFEKMHDAEAYYMNKTLSSLRIDLPEDQRWASPIWDVDINIEQGKFKNDTLIVALMDNKTASAGEMFIERLKRFENVIVVGTNSRGSLLITSGLMALLPNSEIYVAYGPSMFRNPLLENIDGKGLKPDFWVSPADSLDRILKLMDNYLLLHNK